MVAITIAGKEKHVVAETVFSGTNPRLVYINNFQLELLPEGNLLILSQTDQPGIIGKIGTILGKANINIANLQLARTGKGEDALSVWSIDEAMAEATLKEIRKMPQVKEARAVTL